MVPLCLHEKSLRDVAPLFHKKHIFTGHPSIVQVLLLEGGSMVPLCLHQESLRNVAPLFHTKSIFETVDAFLGRTHEYARLRGRRKSTRRTSQHGPV
jgi:hypothetical protein